MDSAVARAQRRAPSPFGRWIAALVCITAMACASRKKAATESSEAPVTKPPSAAASVAPTDDGPVLVLRGARVMTAAGTDYPKADVLLRGSRIAAVGTKLDVPPGAKVIDASGKTITPGIIDTHSHIGVYASPGFTAHSDGNEMVAPTTPQARAEDGFWPQDPQIQRARAGGVTTMQILPGSANLIGGRSVVVKTYPRARTVDEARFAGAPFGLKMACGENPKRVYGNKGGPATRMGNMAGFRAKFQDALEYQRSWDRYRRKLERYRKGERGSSRSAASNDSDDDNNNKGSDGPPDPPSRDHGLETMVGVLEGRVLVHNHCYRADEMALMMQLAEQYGFRIRSFHHAVEAYKVADLLADHGAGASVWADWWGFKAEAFDGIRENAAMIADAGARAIIHSDSAEGIQRLNQEASKAMWAGRRAGIEIDDDEALRWITANPAWALGVEDRVGTLERGKQADLVVWDGDPFSVYTHADRVLIEGRTVYQRGKLSPASDFESGWRHLVQREGQPAARTRAPGNAKGTKHRLSFDGEPAASPLAYKGCTIHVGDGTVLENAAIATDGARITSVGTTLPPGAAQATVPPEPCIITPGFIAASTPLGLIEIGAEDSTKDDSREESPPIRAGYDASAALNAESSLIGVNRIEGVTSAAVTPTGGLLSGQVAWIDLVAGNHRTLVARPSVAVAGRMSTGVVHDSRAAAFALLERALSDAKFYRGRVAAFDRRQSRDLVTHPDDLAALWPVLDGNTPLVVHADRASDILALVQLAKDEGLSLTITGGAQAPAVADVLADAGVVVVVQPSHNLPGNLDRLGAGLDNAARLHAAGVDVAIAALGSAHNARNMAQEVGIALANGLPRDAAVPAVTLHVARAYGMDADYGSLQAGKVANFVVWRGDPFELSVVPEAVIIRGTSVPMTSRQTELRERYRDLSQFGPRG